MSDSTRHEINPLGFGLYTDMTRAAQDCDNEGRGG